MGRKLLVLLLAIAGLPLVAAAARGQGARPAPAATPPAPEKLSLNEQQLADRYHHLEEVLLRMAEVTASSDPRRAALLKRAVAQSKQQLIGLQFEQLVKLLGKDQLAQAIKDQSGLDKDLQSLLELLMSENRAKRLESEKARVAQYLKRLNTLIKQQKGLQSRSESAADPKPLADPQRQLAEQTGGLARQIQANEEAGRAAPQGSDPSKTTPADTARPGPVQGKPSGKPSDKAAGEPSGKRAGKPSGRAEEGQPRAKPESESQAQPTPSEEENPARQRLQEAERRMRQAERRLEEAKRKDAIEEQEQALRELELAKSDLEKILRQLREEEMGRVLAMLEARFLRMLKLQRDVLEGTLRLDSVPQSGRDHSHEIEAGRLSSREVEIVVEADRALLLLREDGTALAFPEALAQARQDMQQVVERLAEDKVGKVTQTLEEEIISALQEMVESLKRAQKKLQDKKRPAMPGGEPGQQALVDVLSELKMIRALQMRVNTRTQRYAKLIGGEQATGSELVEALARLAERQQRIYEITRDLEMGKNR